MRITISGSPGSGKSTVAKDIARKLELEHYSAGGYYRQMAEERKLNVLEFARLAEQDPSIDEELDQWLVGIGRTKDNFVVDARLGWHFIPKSIKIFLNANLKERARRIFSDDVRNEHHITLERTQKDILQREASEKTRYAEKYGIDYFDESGYDLVIDTTHEPVERVVEEIIKFVEGKKND